MLQRVIGFLVLAGCADEAAIYPQTPIRITAHLSRGDVLRCEDQVVRIGLPTDNGWVTVVLFGKRKFECSVVPISLPGTWTKIKVTQYE